MLVYCSECGYKVSKDAKTCLRCGHDMNKDCNIIRKYHVINYDLESDYRVCEVEFQGSLCRIWFADYKSNYPSAIIVKLSLVDEFDRMIWKTDVTFTEVFEDGGSVFVTSLVPVDIYDIDWYVIRCVFAEVKEIEDEDGVHELEEGDYSLINRKNLRKLRIVKKRFGADALDIPDVTENGWKCCCGRDHQDDEKRCTCGIQKKIIEEAKFDFSDADINREDLGKYIDKKLLDAESVYQMKQFILGITEDWPEFAELSEIVINNMYTRKDKFENMEIIRDEVDTFLEEKELS